MGEITLYGNLRDADLERSGSGHAGVVHLGQSTCHAISGRGGWSTIRASAPVPLASGEATTQTGVKTFALKMAQAKAVIWP